MASTDKIPSLVVRSGTGLELYSCGGLDSPYVVDSSFTKDESKFCRVLVFSPDGRYLAWANGKTVQVCRCSDWQVVASLPRPKASALKFSPRGTFLMTWEIFLTSKEKPEGGPNLFIYKTQTGEEVYSVIQKRQSDWDPNWASDESLVALLLNGEVLFMEPNSPEGLSKVTERLGGGRNGSISMSPNHGKPFLAFYVPGLKAAPSMCKIFQYPISDSNQAICSKSFFQADKVELFWNKKGTGLLLLTNMEVDQANNSYYGKQALHFMSTRGDSFSVQLSKEGPIHSVTWSPKSTEFCVIYGFMPAKATIFNLKCDAVHNFDEFARNSAYYNDFGNVLLMGGFGNLRGQIEVYDVSGKEKKKIASMQASDTTLLSWNPNGETFVTATTAPRLRMGNGFKVWHCTGALLHETKWPEGQELLEVAWQKFAPETFKEKPIAAEKVKGIASSEPQPSAQAYRPPGARGIPINPTLPDSGNGKYLPPGMSIDPSKAKNRKNKPKNPKKKNEKVKPEEGEEAKSTEPPPGPQPEGAPGPSSAPKKPKKRQNQKAKEQPPPQTVESKEPASPTGDDDEKIDESNLNGVKRMLKKIERLKKRRDAGETLNPKALNSICNEQHLIQLLEQAKLSQ